MTALDKNARRAGGLNRDIGRPEWESQFMGMLAGSSRPLKKDNPASQDAAEAARILRTEYARIPWIYLAIVGRDGRLVGPKLPDGRKRPEADVVARVNSVGGALGLAGLVLLRDRLVTFIRPFVSGPDVETRLTDAIEKLKPGALQMVREGLSAKEG